MKARSKKKIYHMVFRISSEGDNFIEAGWVENPNKYKDNIYLMINGKTTQGVWEMRVDEALAIITCLSSAVNRKVTGLELSHIVGVEKS